jgi:nicotinamide mononucleotide adenylyltransferase
MIGIFPGRFQPFTNSHFERIRKIVNSYPDIKLHVLIGDIGCLNHDNFLWAEERYDIICLILRKEKIKNVFVNIVQAAYPPELWVDNVFSIIPRVDLVFSDNPFVYEPFGKAGVKTVQHIREGIEGSTLRNKPFSSWFQHIPKYEYDYLKERLLFDRIAQLPKSSRYPFIKKNLD